MTTELLQTEISSRSGSRQIIILNTYLAIDCEGEPNVVLRNIKYRGRTHRHVDSEVHRLARSALAQCPREIVGADD